jgi:O-antigen/teichoic acid export membrane protein
VAVTGTEHAGRLPLLFGGLARLKGWLADGGDNSVAQRMAGTVFLIRVGNAGLAFLSQVLLARWMGTFQYGIFVYVWTWVLLIGGLVDFGIASSAQRFIPEYAERDSQPLLRGFLSASRWIVLATASAVMLLGVLAVRLLEPWIDPHFTWPLYLACITLPLYALNRIQECVARAYDWVQLSQLPTYILRQLALLGLMLVAYLAGFPMNADAAMVASFLAILITVYGQSAILNRRLAAVSIGPKLYDLKTWFQTSLPIVIVEGFYLLLTYTDVLVLQQFRPPDEVGVYYAAAKTLALVAFIYFSVATTTAHKFAAYHVAGERERLAAFAAQSVRWTFWPSLAATLLILALGRPILSLFGKGFSDGYGLMFLLAIGLLARAAIGPVERLLNMLGEQRACSKVYAGALALNICLCFVLIPRFGGAGAAIATSSALVAESVLLFFVTKRRLGLHMFVFGRPAGS